MVQRPPMWFWGWFMKLAPLDTADNYDQIDEAPLVYLKLLRAFYLRFHKLSPLFAEAFPHLGTLLCVPRFHRDLQRLGSPSRENWGFKVSFDGTLAQMRWRNVFESNQISEFLSPRNLLKFIGASVFAAGHALQCIHKGKAAAWLGKTGKSRKAQPTQQWPKIRVEQLLHFFILHQDIRGLCMLFDFIEDCYDPFFGKWFWLRHRFVGWHEIFFCWAVVFRCSNPNMAHQTGPFWRTIVRMFEGIVSGNLTYLVWKVLVGISSIR